MTSKRSRLGLLLFPALLLVASSAAAEQEGLIRFLATKATGLAIVMVAGGAICQVAYVRAAAWLLGIKGGFIHAIGAVVLGGTMGLVLACPAGMIGYILPPAFHGLLFQVVLASGITMAGGVLGVKWVFRTDNLRALIVFTAADAATLLTLCLCVIILMI